MATVEPYEGIIPIEELQDVEESAFEMLHMDRDTVMEQFDDVFEETDEKCRASFVCKGLFKSFEIEGVEDGEVHVEGGATLASPLLADALQHADELIIYAIAVHGYEELAKDPANDMFQSMFIDAWGVGYAMACHRWIKEAIDESVHACGLHVGRSWMPGEGDLPFDLQRDAFGLLDPAQIGIQLSESGSVSPIMIVSGMRGVSDDPAIEAVGLDIPSFH